MISTVALPLAPASSCTVSVNVTVGLKAPGVPDMVPVVVLRDSQEGIFIADHVYGCVPPEAVGVSVKSCHSVGVDTAGTLMESGEIGGGGGVGGDSGVDVEVGIRFGVRE